jgi:hypothetical protein
MCRKVIFVIIKNPSRYFDVFTLFVLPEYEKVVLGVKLMHPYVRLNSWTGLITIR